MLQAHSPLWHYLWLGPQVLQLGLAFFMWRSRLYKAFPIFFAYVLFEAVEEFALYAMDVGPVSNASFWRAYCVGRMVEGFLKIAVIGELFRHLVSQWPSLAKFGNRLITGLAAFLVVFAVLLAAFAPSTTQILPSSRAPTSLSRPSILFKADWYCSSSFLLHTFDWHGKIARSELP